MAFLATSLPFLSGLLLYESLKRHGVGEEVTREALNEAVGG